MSVAIPMTAPNTLLKPFPNIEHNYSKAFFNENDWNNLERITSEIPLLSAIYFEQWDTVKSKLIIVDVDCNTAHDRTWSGKVLLCGATVPDTTNIHQ